MRTRSPMFAAAGLSVATIMLTVTAAAQRPGTPPGAPPGMPQPVAAAQGRASAADTNGVAAVERVSTTHHTTTINGQQFAYTANTGTMVIRDDDGKPRATVFYISYTRDGQDAAKRPVTFFFNGGPGSASIWLNMGIMSPKYPEMGPAGAQPTAPYKLINNPTSPLDATDLVQVDAMMTGYSRPAPGVKASEFTGDVNDIRMFAQFIRNYLDKYNRWQSPKYLFGESYGTFRSAGLANELQSNEGIELNGIMLLGTVLDFQLISSSATNDIGSAAFLPTYTATAWYHKKLPPDLQKLSLKAVVDSARKFAFSDYLVMLARGNSMSAAEQSQAAQRIARLTGVSPTFVDNTNLRIDASTFRTELLRDQRLTLGRYDSRMLGVNGNATSTRPDYDPSDVAPSSAFVAGFMQLLHDDLDYRTNLKYFTGGQTGRWEYSSNFRGGYPSEVEALRTAMAKNPYLRVWVGAGYYDLATPFANAEYTMDHLGFDKSYRERTQWSYYESGHMAYLNQESGKQLQRDITSFVNSTKDLSNMKVNR